MILLKFKEINKRSLIESLTLFDYFDKTELTESGIDLSCLSPLNLKSLKIKEIDHNINFKSLPTSIINLELQFLKSD